MAIALAVVLAPLMLMRSSEPELIQMATSVKVYADTHFSKQVRTAPLITQLVQNISNRAMLIPHVVFSDWDYDKNMSQLDAVAFIGLQKDMLYGQHFEGLRYRSPYVAHRPMS